MLYMASTYELVYINMYDILVDTREKANRMKQESEGHRNAITRTRKCPLDQRYSTAPSCNSVFLCMAGAFDLLQKQQRQKVCHIT